MRGAWLSPGAHLDLIGGFTPTMREADDEAFARASIIVCDTPAALDEAGDLIDPIEHDLIQRDAVVDLSLLCRGEREGRRRSDEITIFRSVGCALEDLAGAGLAYSAMLRGLST